MIEASEVPWALPWDFFLYRRADFEAALAEQMGLSPTDHSAQITVGIALDIFYRSDDQWKGIHLMDYRVLFRETLASLRTTTIIRQALPTDH